MENSSVRDLGERLARHAPRLRLLCAHLAGRALRRHLEVDDLVQEVLVRAISAPNALPAPEPSRPDAVDPALWRHLSLVARHTVIDAARSLRAERRAGDAEAARFASTAAHGPRASQFAIDATGPATAALRREVARDLLGSFERLGPEQRRVLGLRQFEGLTAAECARRMGRTETAIHSLYRRALAAWAAELGSEPLL